MSYIKSLKSLRKELANEASQEPAAPEAPVSRGFASRSVMPAPQAPQELRYDPSLYVKTAMRRIQESRAAFSERTAEAAKKAMEKAPEKAAKASPIAALTAAVMEDMPKPILDEGGSRPGMADREGGSGVDLGENADAVVSGLVDRGMPEHIAHGFAMNFKDESNFDPSALGDDGNALGVAQWNGPRKRALESFAESRGGSATDLEVQLDYLMVELESTQKNAWDKISSTSNANDAAVAILNHFERPAEKHRISREAKYRGGNNTNA